jgi:drug/metabolite transporter (DMT)-like permease
VNLLSPPTSRVPVTRLALGGVAAVIVLNLLLRSLSNLGGVASTLVTATTVAVGMALWFYWRHQRAATPSERFRLLGAYGGVLALLYLALLALMTLKDAPGPIGLLIFSLHYFCYPLLAWLVFARMAGWREK